LGASILLLANVILFSGHAGRVLLD